MRCSPLVYALVLVATASTLLACARPPVNRVSDEPLQTVDYVDVEQYLGLWYEIARFPNRFERDCEGVTAEYSMRDDGKIAVENTCHEGSPDGPVDVANGRARIVDEDTNAKLKVSFFGPFWGDYWIIGLADDYSHALVGEPSGRYLWVLARTPTLAPDVLEGVLDDLRDMGYNVDALYFTEHSP